MRIHDYSDGVPVLVRMLDKRLRAYRTMGYAAEEAQPREAEREQVIEYESLKEET